MMVCNLGLRVLGITSSPALIHVTIRLTSSHTQLSGQSPWAPATNSVTPSQNVTKFDFFILLARPMNFFFTTKREFKFRFCNAGWSYFLKSFSTLLFPFSLKMKEKKEYFIKFSQWKMQTAKAKNREDYKKIKNSKNFRTNSYFLRYKFGLTFFFFFFYFHSPTPGD